MEQTQEYIKWKYKQEDIPLLKIDSSFVLGFEEYLLLEKGLAPITVNKVLQRVKHPSSHLWRISLSDKREVACSYRIFVMGNWRFALSGYSIFPSSCFVI